MKISAIILAGGDGKRFNSTIPKQFMSLNGKPVIQYSINVIEPFVDEIVIVSHKKYGTHKVAKPGKTRQESVYNGLIACDKPKYVIIHDSVRPFITEKMVSDVVFALKGGEKSVDTAIDVVDGILFNKIPVEKRGFMLSQTPEGFDYESLLYAHEKARSEFAQEKSFQDDVSLMFDVLGVIPFIVDGAHINSKITFEKDLENSEQIMRSWQEPLKDVKKIGRVLVFGGSGGIGSAIVAETNADAPTRNEIDVSGRIDIPLHKYSAVVHSVAEYENEDKVFAVNYNSFVQLIKCAEKQGWCGNIVAISSTAALYGREGLATYSASKAALNAYIEARHEELAKKGIYINAIAPAKVWTRLQRTINPNSQESEMLTSEFVAKKTLPYLNTTKHGHIIYLRKGLDK